MDQSNASQRVTNKRFTIVVSVLCVICAAIALFAFIIVPELFSSIDDGSKKQKIERRILTVATIPVHKQTEYQIKRSYIGTVESRRKSRIGFEVPGKLSNLFAEEGEVVEKGQLLAELDVERLEAARNEAGAQLLEAEAALNLARTTLKRTTRAQKLKAVSSQQLDEAAANVKQQQARRARVQAQIERINVDIKKAKLLAPYSGMLAARLSDEGVVLTAGQPVFEIRETILPEIRVGINRDQLDHMAPGTTVIGMTRGQKFELDIDRVLPGRQSLTRVVEVIAVPRDSNISLREGDLVEIVILAKVFRPGFWLPISALTENGRGLWSCLLAEPLNSDDEKQNGSHRLSRRDVEIISLEGDRVYVEGNISNNNSVVFDGLHRVVPNQRVLISKAKRNFHVNSELLK
ncbi:MAG: efflux RND transporter periplasmic adaptor subunit [Desulfotalea sp.]